MMPRSAPVTTGRPRRAGLSACSTAAKKPSASTCSSVQSSKAVAMPATVINNVCQLQNKHSTIAAMPAKSKLSERIPVLNDYIHRNGRAPTMAELCTLFGVRSTNTASNMAKGFVRAGVLGRTATGRFYARPRQALALRLLGNVAAGFPSPAEEALLDTMRLDEDLIKRPEATFMLKVDGDSML